MKYQLIMLFVPDIQESELDNLLEKAQKIIGLTRIDKWGNKKLIYPERAKSRIWYRTANRVTANAEADEVKINKLKKLFDDDRVIKLIVVRSDKR